MLWNVFEVVVDVGEGFIKLDVACCSGDGDCDEVDIEHDVQGGVFGLELLDTHDKLPSFDVSDCLRSLLKKWKLSTSSLEVL